MPLLYQSSRFNEGDLIVTQRLLNTRAIKRWENHIYLEVVLGQVQEWKRVNPSKNYVRMQALGIIDFYPFTYRGGAFGHFRPAHRNTNIDFTPVKGVIGHVCGDLNIDDRYEVRHYLKQLVKCYRRQLDETFKRVMFASEYDDLSDLDYTDWKD